MAKCVLFGVCGLLAGFVNGLLGTGGGIVLIFGMRMLNIGKSGKDVFALTLAVTLGLSMISAIVYICNGGGTAGFELKYIIPASIGGFAGAYLLDRLKLETVKKIFGVLVAIAGANMAGLF